jgi:glutaredoxin
MNIYFYSKDDCPLCEIAEEILNSFAVSYNLNIHRIDINTNTGAYEKYREMIPVIELPDGDILWGSLNKDDIGRALKRLFATS